MACETTKDEQNGKKGAKTGEKSVSGALNKEKRCEARNRIKIFSFKTSYYTQRFKNQYPQFWFERVV